MKILATSDWHFHNYKAHSTIKDGMNSRLIDIRETWIEAVCIGIREKCKVMTISGDLFHVRGALRPSVINLVQSLVEYAVSSGMLVVIIPGNHDMEDYKGGDTAVDFLAKMPGVIVLDGGKAVEIDGVRFAGIPYQHNVQDFIDGAEFLMTHERPDIMLMHQGIDTFKYSPSIPDTGLTAGKVAEIFKGVPVFCGHYHNATFAHGAHGRVFQIGAPLQYTFNDEGQRRGAWVYDTETQAMKFHEISKAPKFVTVTDDERPEWEAGDFIRVKVADQKKADALVKTMRTAGDITVIHTKEFKESDRATIEPGPVRSMLESYIAVTPELGPHAAQLLALYDEVCL